MIDVVRVSLMYIVVPLWVLAGLADWWCHRRSAIEHTSGLRESAFHLVLFAQTGLAFVAVLLLEISAAVIAGLTALLILHELTTWVELRVVVPLRPVSPLEQMVHSFMELLPLTALLLLVALSAAHAAPGIGLDSWQLRSRTGPLPQPYVTVMVGAMVLLNGLPLIEEALRCKRVRNTSNGAA